MKSDEKRRCWRNGVIAIELTPDHILSFLESGFVPENREFCIDALIEAYPHLCGRDRARCEKRIEVMGTDDEKGRFAKAKASIEPN